MMALPDFTPDYLELLRDRPDSFESWQEAEEWLHVVGWPWDRSFWPVWAWPHLTDPMVDEALSLPFRLVYAVLLERSGLPAGARSVLHYLARRCGGENGSPRRAWPKIDVIADRTGLCRRSVQYAIRQAEEAGWLLVVRHRKAPSDYLLDVPDYVTCPCIDCVERVIQRVEEPSEPEDGRVSQEVDEPKGANAAPQGANGAPLEGANAAPQGANIAHALGSEHLVQSLHSEHLRRTSDDVTTVKGSASQKDKGPTVEDRAYTYGETLGREIAKGRLTTDEAVEMFSAAHSIQGQGKAFHEGMRSALSQETAGAA